MQLKLSFLHFIVIYISIGYVVVMTFNTFNNSPVCESKDSSVSNFLSTIESSGWLKHVKTVLDTSVFISKVKILSLIPRLFHAYFMLISCLLQSFYRIRCVHATTLCVDG